MNDKTDPLQTRLTKFYKAYLPAIFRYDWVRIFMFAGLKGVDITQRYLEIIQTKVVEPLAGELREIAGVQSLEETPLSGCGDGNRLGAAWRAFLPRDTPLGVWHARCRRIFRR